MKKIVTILLLLLISFLGFGQSVSTPNSKSFLQSTTAQDGSGFQLNGFSATSTVLTSISLINPSTNTTFYITTTTGLTAASGFTLTGNKTRLVVTGTMADINTALASLKINTGSVLGNVQLSVAATINPTGYFYNGVNGHFYKPISTGNTYTGARAESLLTTFKGQTGYLSTITSADEDAFIYANIPQSNIWFALTDEITEGIWIIDAGPEKGTIIKTQNGQTAGNVVGQYNNWASGEPNNSGNEDYSVTKWGGTQWNDLPNSYVLPYVIEYGTWSNPDNATFTEFYTNSITHSNGEVLRASFNVDFGSNVDETKFSAKGYTYTNNTWNIVNGTANQLSGLGTVDITNNLDINNIGIKSKLNVVVTDYWILNFLFNWESMIVYPYEASLGGHKLFLDERIFNTTSPKFNNINAFKLLDIYDGPVSVYDTSGFWKTYIIPSNIATKITSSAYQTSLRLQDGQYAVKAGTNISYTPIIQYKQHGIELTYTNQTDLNTLYNSIVTISDVFLAFKELSNRGLFGNQSGNEFTSGIQFMNADVDGNSIFNEADTYKLLQHLTGVQPLTQYSALTYLMKLYSKSDYDAITKTNWNTKFNSTRSLYPFSLNTGTLNNTYNVNVTWKGDVNLSHSAQQITTGVAGNSIKTMSLKSNLVSYEVNASLMSENVGNKVIVTISFDPLQQEVVGTQFQLNYDNTSLGFEKIEFTTKETPINFGTDRGTYITLGSLITDGATILDKTTEYKITFVPKIELNGILGLTSISTTDAVNKNGTQLKVNIN